jgi:hypothetical protein
MKKQEAIKEEAFNIPAPAKEMIKHDSSNDFDDLEDLLPSATKEDKKSSGSKIFSEDS